MPDTIEKTQSPTFLNDLVTQFNDWCINIRNVDIENSIDYLYTRRLLEKWVNVPIDQLAQKLNGEKWAATTDNRRLTYLTTFFSWLLSTGVVKRNPLQDVCRRRDKGKKKNPRRKPLDEQEIITFLTAIENNTYCHPSSTGNHSYYYPFLVFMFYTGVRNAEDRMLEKRILKPVLKKLGFGDRDLYLCEACIWYKSSATRYAIN